MSKDKPVASDLMGLAPFGEAFNTLSQGLVEGVGGFLKKICLPAAEELGLLLRDKVSQYRYRNTVAVLAKAKEKFEVDCERQGWHAHPRLVWEVLSHCGWSTEKELQEMWAGLLASSTSRDGQDEGNLMFVNILRQLTASEARILVYSCETATKRVDENGLVYAKRLTCDLNQLKAASGIGDVCRLDRELDHLRSLGMILDGFETAAPQLVPFLSPTALALNMYVRCQGSWKAPAEYWNLRFDQVE